MPTAVTVRSAWNRSAEVVANEDDRAEVEVAMQEHHHVIARPRSCDKKG
jgi:hypothetical protein